MRIVQHIEWNAQIILLLLLILLMLMGRVIENGKQRHGGAPCERIPRKGNALTAKDILHFSRTVKSPFR